MDRRSFLRGLVVAAPLAAMPVSVLAGAMREKPKRERTWKTVQSYDGATWTADQWIGFDFGAPVTITEVIITA